MAGIAFPLHQGYLLEGVSLTNDDIYSSSLQCYQRIKVIHYLAIFHFEAAESGNVGFSFARLNTTTETAEHTKNEQMSESTNMDSGEGLKLKLQRFSCCELNTYTLQNAFFSCHFSCTDMSWVIATQAGLRGRKDVSMGWTWLQDVTAACLEMGRRHCGRTPGSISNQLGAVKAN